MFFFQKLNKAVYQRYSSLNLFNYFVYNFFFKKKFIYTFNKLLMSLQFSLEVFIYNFNKNIIKSLFFKLFLVRTPIFHKKFLSMFEKAKISYSFAHIINLILILFKILKINYKSFFKFTSKKQNSIYYRIAITLLIFSFFYQKSLVYTYMRLQKKLIKIRLKKKKI